MNAEETQSKLPHPLPGPSGRTCLIPPARAVAHTRCCQGSSLDTQGFHWGWSHRCLAHNKFQISGSRVLFSINHGVCTNRVSPVSHSFQLEMMGVLPKPKFPDARRTNLASQPFKGQWAQASMLTPLHNV